MPEADRAESSGPSLAASAKASILWGGGSTLVRDLVQFATMLVLVRWLSPEDYGRAALAQSIIGLLSVVSFGTFAVHALQLRDPGQVDWQAHFTAAAVINSVLFCVTLAIAWALSFTRDYYGAALPLAGLAILFLVEIPGTLRHRMLETRHDWKRFRLLLVIGTLLAAAVGLMVAFAGGGVWALVVQPPLLGLPAAIDLLWRGKWRPDWSWSWMRYRETWRFGANRLGAAVAQRGRQAVEHTVLTGAYDFGGLGVFTRTIGLATLAAGRIGSIAITSLYPVVTRAEVRSEHFQRISGLVLRGVCWTTIPAATFLAHSASDIVALLYGPKWVAVASLLPFAAVGVALAGIASTLSSLLLANDEARTTLWIDFASAGIAVGLAWWLVPLGIDIYLVGLVGHGMALLLLTLAALAVHRGIATAAILPAFLPALVASMAGALAVEGLRMLQLGSNLLPVRIGADAALFASTYLLTLRIMFPNSLGALLEFAPAGRRIARGLMLPEEQA